MHVFTELLTCPLPRITSPARLYLNSKPLSSYKKMAIFLNQLCSEMFPSPNKQVISSPPFLSYSGPKPMTTSSCCALRPSRARHKCWQHFYDRNVSGKKFQQLYMDQVSPIGKILSALLRERVLATINENSNYQLWVWEVFTQRKPSSDYF